MRLRINENTVWIDFQDYSADEILYASKTTLFYKTTRFTSEITTLFRVPPQLFHPNYSSSRKCVARNVFAIEKDIVRDFYAPIEIIQHCGGNGRCTFSEIVLYTGD